MGEILYFRVFVKHRIMFWVLLLVLGAAGVAVLFFLPPPHRDFFDLYPEDDMASRSLREFRSRPLKSVEAVGETWHYFSGGNGEKVLLFVHGMGGAYDIWWNQIMAFEGRYKVISYTLPPKVNSLKRVQEGILAILQKEGVGRFTVIGTSMGGYIARFLVQQVPERIDKAVFGNTFPPNNLLLNENRAKRKILPFLPEIILYRLSKKHLKDVVLPAAQESALLYAVLASLPFDKKQFIHRLDIVLEPFPLTTISHSVPLLIFESDNDPLIPQRLREELKNACPTAIVHTFHQKGHFPYINAAREYNRVLADFLKDT